MHSSERPGPGAAAGGVRPAQMRSSAASFAKISPEVILRDEGKSRVIFVRYETYITLRPVSCTYKQPYISPWKHTCSYSFYTLHRQAHRSTRTDRTFRRCKSHLGYRPALSDGQSLLRPLLYCPAPATPSSMPDFCCFPGGQSRAPLCIITILFILVQKATNIFTRIRDGHFIYIKLHN